METKIEMLVISYVRYSYICINDFFNPTCIDSYIPYLKTLVHRLPTVLCLNWRICSEIFFSRNRMFWLEENNANNMTHNIKIVRDLCRDTCLLLARVNSCGPQKSFRGSYMLRVERSENPIT